MKALLFFVLLVFQASVFARPLAHDDDYKVMLDRVVPTQTEFPDWIRKYHGRLKANQLYGLGDLSKYLDRKVFMTGDWLSKVTLETKAFVDEFYLEMDEKFIQKGVTTYFRRGKSRSVLFYVPVPHFGLPSENHSLFRAIISTFPEHSIVYFDPSDLVTGQTGYERDEMKKLFTSAVQESVRKWKLQDKRKTFFIVCFGSLLAVPALVDLPESYDNVILLAPPVRNLKKGHLISPHFIYSGETNYSVDDFFYQYFTIQKDLKVVIPYFAPRKLRNLNVSSMSELFRNYEEGLPVTKLRNRSVIIADLDQVVPPENSSGESFPTKKVLSQSDHLDLVTAPDNIAEIVKFLGVRL